MKETLRSQILHKSLYACCVGEVQTVPSNSRDTRRRPPAVERVHIAVAPSKPEKNGKADEAAPASH
jgi:hypothetical protein